MAFIQGESVVIIVMTGDVKIDNSKYKAKFHTKAKMVPYDDVGQIVGHNAGGVCPFAINDGVKVYLDDSLKKYETVFPACGSSNSAIELTFNELEKYCQNFSGWIDVTKNIIE